MSSSYELRIGLHLRIDRYRGTLAVLTATLFLLTAGAASAATLVVTGPPGATVVINDQATGFLPLDGALELAPGRYVVTSELQGYRPFSRTVTLGTDSDHLVLKIRLDRLSRSTAWRSSVLFAGLGQFHVGHRTRGWLYAAAETGGLLTAAVGELQRSNYRKDHLVLVREYQQSINADRITVLRAEADEAYAQMEDAESLRDMGLMVAAAAIVVSVADALFTFPKVAAGPGPVPPVAGAMAPTLTPEPSLLTSVHAGVKLTF